MRGSKMGRGVAPAGAAQKWTRGGGGGSSAASPLQPAGFEDAAVNQFSTTTHATDKPSVDPRDAFYKAQDGTDVLSNLYHIAVDGEDVLAYKPEHGPLAAQKDPAEVYAMLTTLKRK